MVSITLYTAGGLGVVIALGAGVQGNYDNQRDEISSLGAHLFICDSKYLRPYIGNSNFKLPDD